LTFPIVLTIWEFCNFPIHFRKEQEKVANHKSALKRAGQNERRRMRNKAVHTRVKNVVKDVALAVSQGDDDTGSRLDAAKSVIDKAAKKGVLHKRTAARKISRLAKKVNAQPA
jgi:small subunit ribosomal protein S20